MEFELILFIGLLLSGIIIPDDTLKNIIFYLNEDDAKIIYNSIKMIMIVLFWYLLIPREIGKIINKTFRLVGDKLNGAKKSI